MCGILAISSVENCDFPVDQVLTAIEHRGPDGRGLFVSEAGDCHLAHVRLAIVDLSSAGRQPMEDSSGRYIISYNGEVYNFPQLRNGIEQMHGPLNWRSNTDTEVIVEGFAREGPSFLDKLNGIFAFAIYDKVERLLHILRDPLGIKPLFITEQQGGVFFCSELKGLLQIPSLTRTLRLQSFAEQLAFMYVPEPYTLYNEYKKVQPGIFQTYSKGKLIASQSLFTHLNTNEKYNSEEEAVEALQHSFAGAVRRQMIADVPVSLFLSGGLDSSAVAYQAREHGAKIQDAYTISVSEEDQRLDAQSDDLKYAALMADRLGLDLKVITARGAFLEHLPKLISFMEDGFSDPAAINTYLICREARKDGVKVMLSGQGADEYLGGYRRYLAEKILRKIPTPIRKIISVLATVLPQNLPGKLNSLNRRLVRISELAGKSNRDRVLGMYTWTAPSLVKSLFNQIQNSTMSEEFLCAFDSHSDLDVTEAMMKLDQHYDLMSLNLCYTDRMSMAVGVEARVPFLDFDLVRVMNSIPSGLKIKGRQGKYLLKKAMEPYLPKEVIYRGKAGFGLPIRAWLKSGNDMVDHYLNPERVGRQGIFNSEAVKQLLMDHVSGKKDHSYTIWTLLTQQMWLEENNVEILN